MRVIYKILGLFFVGLGFLGAVLPVLPTTPFLLLALWLFTRSSPGLKRWLLTNKMCGRYISDFHNGNGIPFRVKIYTLVLLWAAIAFSALYAADQLWLKILLFAVAAGVSVHILRFKTKTMFRNITILVPTGEEAAGIRGKMPSRAKLVVSGVGMAETAAAVASILSGKTPDILILAGIAGAYPDSGLQAGDCIIVKSERICDLGAIRGGAFTPLYQKEYGCPATAGIKSLKSARGCTVNTGGTEQERLARGDIMETGLKGCDIENMEGAAFFAVCAAAGIPFLEIRAVSNLTTDGRGEWKLEEAVAALADGVEKVITELRKR